MFRVNQDKMREGEGFLKTWIRIIITMHPFCVRGGGEIRKIKVGIFCRIKFKNSAHLRICWNNSEMESLKKENREDDGC